MEQRTKRKQQFPDILQSLSGILMKKRITMLTLLLFIGVFAGAGAAVYYDIYSEVNYIPTLFSGIPRTDGGFIPIFSTYLLHTLVFLIPIYIFGMSAFGSAFIAVAVLLKGFVCGIGALSYICTGTLQAVAQGALQYTPALAVNTFLTIAFALRASSFSKSINNAVKNKNREDAVHFRGYFSELMMFLFAVVVSCAMIAVLVWGTSVVFKK